MAVIVWVTDQFEGYHRWAAAPEEVDFLKEWHRHLFHVKMGVRVTGLDREVEFFMLKRLLDKKLGKYRNEKFEASCEMIATDLLDHFNAEFVEVSEDGENGAIVTKSLPAWANQGKCFVGIEAEGPWRGRTTLFVPGSVTPERFRACLKQAEVKCIYYGAGNDHGLRQDTLEAIRESDLPIIIEVDRLRPELKDVTWAKVVGLDCYGHDFVKWFEEDRIVWVDEYGCRWITSKQDPWFQADLYVE